jgi:hypothetical protein
MWNILEFPQKHRKWDLYPAYLKNFVGICIVFSQGAFRDPSGRAVVGHW